MKTRPDKPNDDQQREELRQQLWELAYGLLEPQDEAALVARVKSDPAVARLYAEVKLQTDLVGTAARVEDSSLSISATGAGVGSAVGVNKEKRAPGKSSSRAVPAAKAAGGAFGTNWLAVAGTTALLLLLGYGLWQPAAVTTSVAHGEYFYTRVTGLAAMTEGITQKVAVEYKDIHNQGRATEFEVRLVDQQGQETYRTKVKTAENGRAEVDLPGVVLKKGVRLEVAPAADRRAGRSEEVVSTELQIAEEQRKTVVLTERPYAEPGESNRFQMFGIGQYSKSITSPATDELMVEKKSGSDVVQPMWTVDPANGVISGEYRLPQNYSADDGLAMRRRGSADAKANEDARQLERGIRLADGNARESLELQRGLNGAAKPGLAKAMRAEERDGPGGEGGAGAAFGGNADRAKSGMARNSAPAGAATAPPAPQAPRPENTAGPAVPDPSANRKNAAATPAAPDLRSADKPMADAATKPGAAPAPGFSPPPAPNSPQPKEAEQQKDQQLAKQEKATVPAEGSAEAEQADPRPAESKKFAEERKTLESLQPRELQVKVPAQVRGEDLVLVARGPDGQVVARRELAAYKEAEARVDLPPEVNGLVDVELFRKDQPGVPVLRQQLVRASARSLSVQVSGVKDSYAPGEKVQLSVRVVDESGRPAPAAASVRVWNDVAARAASSPLLLVESLAEEDLDLEDDRRTGTALLKAPVALALNAPSPELDRAELLERKSTVESETAEKQLSSSQGEVPPAASEVFFVDNRSLIEEEYNRAVAIQEMERTERLQSIGRILMWAGAGLLLLIGLLLVARRPLKAAVLIPAVGLAALSLGLGVAWFLPREQAAWQLARALPDELAAPSAEIAPSTLPVKQFGDDMKSSPAAENPLPSDAPTLPIAPGAPVEPTAPPQQALKQLGEGGYGAGGGQSEAAGAKPGATYGLGAERKVDQDEQAKNRSGEDRGGKNQPGETRPLAGIDAARGPAAAKKSDGNAEKRDRSAANFREQPGQQPIPDSLFWRPLSPIESDGTFTIEFSMPAAESDYRLLIDAIGSGRIGGKEQILHCRAE